MKLIVDSLAIEYQDTGQGPLLLFLHGWGSDSKAFAGLSDALQSKYRVVTVDLPGFGLSQQPRSEWHIADYARFTRAFLDKVGGSAELHALLGHSFGGRVIIKAVSNNLLLPRKVILMGSAGIKPKKTPKQRFYKLAAKIGRVVLSLPGLSRFSEPLRRRLYGHIGVTDYIDSGSMQKIFLNTINEDLRSDAAKSTVPALLIWGADDNDTPLYQGEELHALMSGSTLEVLDDAGHYVFLDRPADVTRKIKEFL